MDTRELLKTLRKLKQMLNILQNYMKDAGLMWNSKKCKFMALKRGKFYVHEDITLQSGDVIKCLKNDENYEFMGVPQHAKMDDVELGNALLKKVKQRSHVIWSSQLIDFNKCLASNIFINSAVEYYFWAVKFPISVPKEMDSSIRENMNITGSKHTNQMNVVNYMPRAKGGRGLRSLEESYKDIKIKLAIKLSNDTDSRMAIVRKFHETCIQSKSFSIFKDAERYTKELSIKMTVNEGEVSLFDIELDGVMDEKMIARTLKSKRYQRKYDEIMSSTWQGVNYNHRMKDENVVRGYFDWLQDWKTCPTSVINEVFLLFYQLLPTKEYTSTRSNEKINDMSCRICCASQTESVKHLLSNCGEFAKGLYISRHDNALKCFVWPLLHQFNIIDKQPAWFSEEKVKPFYENEKFRFWWDCPEYTGRDNEAEHPPRPDGKIIIDDENGKKIFLIEMTVPWPANRKEKYEYKCSKYLNILQSLKFENPEHEVGQITLVIDVYGGYGKDLAENIKKIVTEKMAIKSIIRNMQKSVISSAANLSRTFKIRTKY